MPMPKTIPVVVQFADDTITPTTAVYAGTHSDTELENGPFTIYEITIPDNITATKIVGASSPELPPNGLLRFSVDTPA